MVERLDVQVRFDATDAQQQIDNLRQQLAAAIASASATPFRIVANVDDVPAQITSAVEAGDTTAVVTADASQVTGEVTGAVDAADSVVPVSGDTSQLTADLNAAAQAAGGIQAPIQGTSQALGTASQRAAGLAANLGGLGGQVAGASGAVSGLVQNIGAARLGTAALVGTTIAAGVSYNALEQRSKAAFTAILGSAEAAASLQSQLREFASTSPFPRQAFIEAAQTMTSFGIETEKVIPLLGSIQDGVAAFGGGSQELLRIVDIFSDIQAQGRISGTELQRFGFVGINALELLAEQAGVSAQEMADAISNGAVDAETAIDGISAGLEERFGGAAANLSQTWSGALDRIKGATRDLGSAIVEPFISKDGGGAAVDFINDLSKLIRKSLIPSAEAFGKAISTALSVVVPVLSKLISLFIKLPAPIQQAAIAMTILNRRALQTFGRGLINNVRLFIASLQLGNGAAASLKTGVLGLSIAVKTAVASFLPMLAVTLALEAATKIFGVQSSNAASSIVAANQATRDQAGIYQELAAGAISAAQAQEQLADATTQVADAVLEDLVGSADEARRALAEVGITTKVLGQLIDGNADAFNRLTDAQLETIAAQENQQSVGDRVTAGLKKTAQAGFSGIGVWRGITAATEDTNNALHEAVAARQEEVESLFDAAVANHELTQAQADQILATNTQESSVKGFEDGLINVKAALASLANAQRTATLVAQAADVQTAIATRNYEKLGEALDNLKEVFPSLGTVLGQSLSTVGDQIASFLNGLNEKLNISGEDALLFTAMFGDRGQLGGAIADELDKISETTSTFFDNVFNLSGSPALQAALLELGPQNVGAQMFAQLAANEPQVRAGAEKAFAGIQVATLIAETQLESLRTVFRIQGALIGSDGAGAIANAFHKKFGVERPLSSATATELLAMRDEIINAEPGLAGDLESLSTQINLILAEKLSLGEVTEDEVDDAIAAIRDAKEPAKSEAGLLGSGVRTGIEDGFRPIKPFLDTLGGEAGAGAAKNTGKGFSDAIPTAAQEAMAAAAAAIGVAANQIQAGFSVGQGIGILLVFGIAQGVTTSLGAVIASVLALFSRAQPSAAQFAQAFGITVGQQADTGMAIGLFLNSGQVTGGVISTIAIAAASAVEPARLGGLAVGSSLAYGMIQGMNALQGQVEGAGRSLGKAAAAGAGDAGSPTSHLFYDEARKWPKAIADALNDGSRDPFVSAQSLARSVAKGLDLPRAGVPRVSVPLAPGAVGNQAAVAGVQIDTIKIEVHGVPDRATAQVVGDEIASRVSSQLSGQTKRNAITKVRTG